MYTYIHIYIYIYTYIYIYIQIYVLFIIPVLRRFLNKTKYNERKHRPMSLILTKYKSSEFYH